MILGKEDALIFFYSQIPSNRNINVKADDGLYFHKHFNFMYMCPCAHANATATCWCQRTTFRKSVFSTMWVSQGLDSGCQAWQHVPLSAELSCQLS